MTVLSFRVPSEFWAEGQPATLHFRRLSPGVFDPIPDEVADGFLFGTEPLPLDQGWHEFLEAQLVPVAEGIKPRLCLRRVPIDATGRIDRNQLEADRSLPQEERSAKHGWTLTAHERVQFERAMDELVDSRDTEVLSSFLDLFVPNGRPRPDLEPTRGSARSDDSERRPRGSR